MKTRNKSIGIETLAVMIVLVIFAFVVFTVIEAGANAYDGITRDKQHTAGARTAYSYISMKVKQHDTSGGINVVSGDFGDTLCIDIGNWFVSYIFYADGALYECITKEDGKPSVGAANRITHLDGFSLKRVGNAIEMECVYGQGNNAETVTGTVGIRSGHKSSNNEG